MKNKEKKVKIKVKPARQTRAERQNAKFVQMASEELQLCAAVGAFHKAYLEIEFGCEEAYYENIQARLEELQPAMTIDTTVVDEDGIGNFAGNGRRGRYKKQTFEF